MSKEDIRARVIDLIGEDGLAQAFAPIEEASGLPNAAYWSDEWLALEQEHCFRLEQKGHPKILQHALQNLCKQQQQQQQL